MTKRIIYRKDIDGLRAIAVIAVIFYHLDASLAPAGFFGVDIFFVISGYLITQSIRSDINKNSFTIYNFYIRRVRRIIPALFFIVLVTTVFSFFILPINELREYVKSVFSVSTFTSNLFFWRHTDYFSVAAELKPLLHTWSLGIEEQFYILFPVFMLLTRSLTGNRIKLWIAILLLLSFALNTSPLGINYPIANFFLPFTRVWELFIGAFIAINIDDARNNKTTSTIFSFVGLAMILSSIFLLGSDSVSVFLGVNALLPTLGTALIIYFGNGPHINMLSFALSNYFIRYIGLISYSLYLWHWPVIALTRNIYFGEFTLTIKLVIFTTTFILSALTYTFVEQPFRTNQQLKSFLRLKAGAGALATLSVLAGLIFVFISTQYPADDHGKISKTCFITEETLDSTQKCSFGDKNSDKIFLLYGDSHSNAMYPAFKKLALNNGWRGILATFPGCPPLFNVFRNDGNTAKYCTGEYSNNIEKFLVEYKDNIDKVFLVSRWTIFQNGWIKRGRLQRDTHFLSDNQVDSKDADDSSKVLKDAIIRTVNKISRELTIPTHILAPLPVLPSDDIRYVEISREEYVNQRQYIDEIFNTFKQYPLVNIIDPINIFCPTHSCIIKNQSGWLYQDDNHVSTAGALLLLPLLQTTINERNLQ